jgi:hypothetical protein
VPNFTAEVQAHDLDVASVDQVCKTTITVTTLWTRGRPSTWPSCSRRSPPSRGTGRGADRRLPRPACRSTRTRIAPAAQECGSSETVAGCDRSWIASVAQGCVAARPTADVPTVRRRGTEGLDDQTTRISTRPTATRPSTKYAQMAMQVQWRRRRGSDHRGLGDWRQSMYSTSGTLPRDRGENTSARGEAAERVTKCYVVRPKETATSTLSRVATPPRTATPRPTAFCHARVRRSVLDRARRWLRRPAAPRAAPHRAAGDAKVLMCTPTHDT